MDIISADTSHDVASVADEATHLLDSGRPPALPPTAATATATTATATASSNSNSNIRQQQARNILLSTTLTRLGSRSWEFATPLLLLEWSPGSLAAPAALGLTCALFRFAVSPWLGGKADKWDRFWTVVVGTGMQAVGCCVSVGALMVWKGLSSGSNEEEAVGGGAATVSMVAPLTLSLVIVAGVIETLGAQLASVAVKKEWVPIVFADEDNHSNSNINDDDDDVQMMNKAKKRSPTFFSCMNLPPITLSFINTTMTNIDLLAAMFGPVLAGWILQVLGGEGGSMEPGFVAIALVNAISFVPEVYLLRRVYHSCPGLKRRRGGGGEENENENDNNSNKNSIIKRKDSKNNASEQQRIKINGNGTTNELQSNNPWSIWFHHPSGLPLLTLSLASLYLTALSSCGVILTAYLMMIGLSPKSIGIFRAFGSFSGVLGIGLFSLCRRWGGATTTTDEAERSASVKSIERLRRVSLAFLLLQVASVLVAAWAHFMCESANLMSSANSLGGGGDNANNEDGGMPWQIVLFMGAVVVSRAGLYAFDVGALEIEQYVVDERYRNAVGSVEGALCSLAEMGMYVLSIILPDPSQFGVQVNVSAAAVTCGGVCFGCFLGLYHMHRHNHDDDCHEVHHHLDYNHDHDHHHQHSHAHTYQQERDLKEYGYHIHLHRHQSNKTRPCFEGVPSPMNIYHSFGGHSRHG